MMVCGALVIPLMDAYSAEALKQQRRVFDGNEEVVFHGHNGAPFVHVNPNMQERAET